MLLPIPSTASPTGESAVSTAPSVTALQASPAGLPPPTMPPVIASAASLIPSTGAVAASQTTLALARSGAGWVRTTPAATAVATATSAANLRGEVIALQFGRQ